LRQRENMRPWPKKGIKGVRVEKQRERVRESERANEKESDRESERNN
jgi:hypothetical protein